MKRLMVVAVAAMLAGAGIGAQQSTALEKLFASAEHKATVEGDLRGAIGDYERIVAAAGSNQALAARALLAIADVYRTLTDVRERAVLARIVNDYRDQPAAKAAQSRLALLRQAPGDGVAAGSRVLSTMPGDGGHVSRDGRWLPFTDWTNLLLRDLRTGRDIQLTDTGVRTPIPQQQYPDHSRISPDGKNIAFSWFNSERYEIRLLGLDPPGGARPVTLYHNADIPYIHPHAWSPDGRSLAVGLRRADQTGQVAILSVSDGTLQPLESFPWSGWSSGMAFSPDGKVLAYDVPSEGEPNQRDVYVLTLGSRQKVAIAPHRRDDQVVTWSPDGKHLLFSSDRTGSVQLWVQRIEGGNASGPPRSLTSDFSGVFVGISNDGSLYDVLTTRSTSLFRIVDFDIAKSRATSSPVDPGEEYFSSNLRAQAEWSVDGKQLALYRRTGADPQGGLLTILGPDDKKVRDVRPRLHGFWTFSWARDGKSFFAAGEDLKGRSGIVQIDAISGAAAVIADDETWPTPISVLGDSPDGRALYYARLAAAPGATFGGRALHLIERQLEGGAEREIGTLDGGDLPRVPDFWRPVLSPDGRHIVANVVRADGERVLMLIDVRSGAQRRISARSGEVLMWAPDSGSLFVRERAGAQEPKVVRIRIDTGMAEVIDWTFGNDTHSFRVHPDGHRLIYVTTTSPKRVQLRMLTGLLSQLNGDAEGAKP